jgi:hypothetical protein
VPFLPGTGSHKLDETLELTAAARSWAPTRRSSSRRTTRAPLRRPSTSGTRRWPGSSRTCRSSPTTCPPHRRRHRAGDGEAAVHRLRELRRRQGDDEGLRALLARPARLRPLAAGVVRHRAALPAAAGARRRRVRVGRRQPRADGGGPDVRAVGGRRVRRRPRPALPTAPAGRPAVRRDQPGARQVGARTSRAASPLACPPAAHHPTDAGLARRSARCSPRAAISPHRSETAR